MLRLAIHSSAQPIIRGRDRIYFPSANRTSTCDTLDLFDGNEEADLEGERKENGWKFGKEEISELEEEKGRG